MRIPIKRRSITRPNIINLSNVIVRQPPSLVHTIRAKISESFGIGLPALCSRRGRERISWARQVGMYLALELTDATQDEIARCFGKLDHATAGYAWEAVKARMDWDSKARAQVEALAAQIQRA